MKNVHNKFKKKDIPFFSFQKWDKNTWYPLIEYIGYQKKVKKTCKIEYAVNIKFDRVGQTMMLPCLLHFLCASNNYSNAGSTTE